MLSEYKICQSIFLKNSINNRILYILNNYYYNKNNNNIKFNGSGHSYGHNGDPANSR